jgi:maltose alpha-D-glucosyltransferase/alpha-amylase
MPEWLEKTVFYEIYPQTFYDSNGDGIGDIQGIIEKLDYVKGLGCNALWINPCFDSPFKDAGYDVRDYKKVAPRYGSNEDLFRLFDEAHRRNMRVLLDLVPGHTSEEHSWFTESKKVTPNDEFKNRYIWTDSWFFWGSEGLKFIAGETERDGCYIINFFKCQPALNYGFLRHSEKWQLPPEHPDCIATREALKDIMRFWLTGDRGRGCDGFRVDMADSLVKFDDSVKSATGAIWRNIREMLDSEFPQAALVSEWGNPIQSLKAGFHMDFLLDHPNSGYRSLLRDYEDGENNSNFKNENNSFFKKEGNIGIERFLNQYLLWYEAARNDGYISMITGNHDTPRISYGLDERELALAYAFIFTMPGVPFLYYGDEIGMRYISSLPTKEGGYSRTGSRTPMQWNSGGNMGFSAAPAEKLYLPVDADPAAPNVAEQEKDPSSLLNTVKSLLRLRNSEGDLCAKPNLEILHAAKDPSVDSGNRLFIYRRGAFVMAVNPGADTAQAKIEVNGTPKAVFAIGDCSLNNGLCKLGTQSFGVWKV